MKLTLAQLTAEYTARYTQDSDASAQAMLAMLRSAASLSPAAQAEFAAAFDFEFALDGEIYLGTKLHAKISYPHLQAEAEAAGIMTRTR